MKQLVQNNQTGEIELVDIPRPVPKGNELLVRNLASAVSSGTERGNLDFARAGILAKARRRPDLVNKVINKARQEGVVQAYREAKARLDLPFPLGYSSAGVVVECGPGASHYSPGTLVSCSGAHSATHGEWITVPETMAAEVPQGVEPEEAAFAALGAVVVHALRIGDASFGSNVAIIGLGLLGLLGIQLTKAAGMQVCGIDVSEYRVDKARQLGADLALPVNEVTAEAVTTWARDVGGADVVIISATSPTNEPLVLGAEIARERGVLVLLGNFPPDLPRRYGYDKELSLRFTRAWGPGTYDPAYQERGHEEGYPPSLVRWNARRNLSTYLQLVARRDVSVRPLVTHRFEIDEAARAYSVLDDPSALAICIHYPDAVDESLMKGSDAKYTDEVVNIGTNGKASSVGANTRPRLKDAPCIGVIGAGNYCATQLLPTLSKLEGVHLKGIASASGLKAWFAARKYEFEFAASDFNEILDDPEVDGVVIATRHDMHAELASRALLAGKHVWVEKPLALDLQQLSTVMNALGESAKSLIVGFNRRHSPLAKQARDVLGKSTGPILITMLINPGPLEEGHWVLDPEVGGGRLLAEGCHFFDLANYLAGTDPTLVTAALTGEMEPWRQGFVATVEYEGGSVAQISYAGAGPKVFEREHISAVGAGTAAAISNFKNLSLATGTKTITRRSLSLQKGFDELARAFVDMVRRENGNEITRHCLVSTALTLAAQDSLKSQSPLAVSDYLPRP